MKEVRKISQCDRLREIIKNNRLTQRKFAETIKVTESYVSMLLKDENINISLQLLELIEKIYGYNANWIVEGKEPKFSQISKDVNIPETNRKLVAMIEQLTLEQSKAVMAFVNSLEEIENALLFQQSQTHALEKAEIQMYELENGIKGVKEPSDTSAINGTLDKIQEYQANAPAGMDLRIARSSDHAPAQWRERDASFAERIKNAKRVTSMDDA